MKKLNISVAVAVIFSILMSLACFDASCADIRTRVLRLHILANSDSEEDQTLKLAVRDRLLSCSEEIFGDAETMEEVREAARQGLECREPVGTLIDLVLEFNRRMEKKKREKKVIDFSDMEHLALQILVEKDEKGNVVPTKTALEYQDYFHMVPIILYYEKE